MATDHHLVSSHVLSAVLSRLQEESGYKSVFLVRFEDLVREPGRVIQRTVSMESKLLEHA